MRTAFAVVSLLIAVVMIGVGGFITASALVSFGDGPDLPAPGTSVVDLADKVYAFFEPENASGSITVGDITIVDPSGNDVAVRQSKPGVVSVNDQDYIGFAKFEVQNPGEHTVTITNNSSTTVRVALNPLNQVPRILGGLALVTAGGLLVLGTIVVAALVYASRKRDTTSGAHMPPPPPIAPGPT